MTEVYTKRCWKCGSTKPLSEFHKNKNKPLGVHTECKRCRLIDPLLKRPISSHCPNGHALIDGNLRGGIRADNGRRECLTCHRQSGKRRYWNDPESRRKESRDYAQNHKAEGKARLSAWKAQNAEYLNAFWRLNSRRRRVGRTKESISYIQVLLRDPCSYCGNPSEVIDHIQPIAKGGDSQWNNLTAACRRCNHAKMVSGVVQYFALRTVK